MVQVNLCQKLFFLQNMGRTCCVQKLFWMSETISVHNMFSSGLSLEFSCIELVNWWKNKSFWQRFTCNAFIQGVLSICFALNWLLITYKSAQIKLQKYIGFTQQFLNGIFHFWITVCSAVLCCTTVVVQGDISMKNCHKCGFAWVNT